MLCKEYIVSTLYLKFSLVFFQDFPQSLSKILQNLMISLFSFQFNVINSENIPLICFNSDDFLRLNKNACQAVILHSFHSSFYPTEAINFKHDPLLDRFYGPIYRKKWKKEWKRQKKRTWIPSFGSLGHSSLLWLICKKITVDMNK